MALTSIVPYGIGYAEETDQMQVDIQEDSFRTGELTKPSKTPESVVKDALKEKRSMFCLQNKLVETKGRLQGPSKTWFI